MQILLLVLAALLIGSAPAGAIQPASDDLTRRTQDVPHRVEFAGILVNIDHEREALRVQTSRGTMSVELFDETEILLASGRRSRLSELRDGTEIRVRGEQRSGRVLAHRIDVIPAPRSGLRAGPASDRSRGEIIGTVRTPTYLLSRKLKVRTDRGDVTVDAERDTKVVQYDEQISVHELERGDRVHIAGLWTGEQRLRAARIDVLDPDTGSEATRGYRSDLAAVPMPVVTVTGFLVSHDEDRDRMRLSTRNGDRIIVANGTPAFMGNERISRREIRQGDRVRAVGYWNGREILATRVELAF